MARPRTGPTLPRDIHPDLPPVLAPHTGLEPRSDLFGVRIENLSGSVSNVHGQLMEARIDGAQVDRWDTTGAAWTDVAVGDLRATELVARESAWRTVEIDGGRIATVDALRAAWDGVSLRGLRIDYLNLASATVSDLLLVDCEIGALDIPQARLTRVAFRNCRIDEVDTRGLRAEHVDLRGLEALRFTDPRGLAGATLSMRQTELHGAAFAAALGIRLAP